MTIHLRAASIFCMNIHILADEIIYGRRLTRQDSFLSEFETCELSELCREADRIQKHFKKDSIELCAITSGRNGKCGENCKFCAQSAWYATGCTVREFPEPESVVAEAKRCKQNGINRFSIVSSGKALPESDTEKAARAFRLVKEETGLSVCASFGFLTDAQLDRMKEAGVTRIHCNVETSERFFPEICTTHSFTMKLQMIQRARAKGFSICSGGIIGMGERFADRIDLALTLAELGVESVPLNVLTPIPGTPLENQAPLSEEEILRTTAMFRFIHPATDLRLAGGRKLYDSKKALESGASASITGDYLTTYGYTVQSDKEMIHRMGRTMR